MTIFLSVYCKLSTSSNKYLIEFHAWSKPSTYIKIWCHLLVLAPIIYQFLHPFFKLLLVPATIAKNSPDTKMIIDICLSHYIEFMIATTRSSFSDGKMIFCSNNYTSLSLKHSCFLRFGGWSVSMLSYLYFKCYQTRARLLSSRNEYQKLHINRVRWSKRKMDLEKSQFWEY